MVNPQQHEYEPLPTPDVVDAAAPSTHAQVRVVTVAYNPGEELERFLASLRAATTRPVTVVIADNGQEHDVVDSCAHRYRARVVRDGGNHGYGGGANRAAQGLVEEWIVVANPDLVWHEGALDALIDAAARHPRVGAAGPQLLNADGSVYPSARALPSLRTGVGHALLTHVWPGNPFSQAYHGPRGGHEPRTVGWLSGACLLLPAAVWRELGGFDDSYFMFFEDVDLGQRVGRAGYDNLYVPAAVVTHEQGASWKARPEKMIRAHHESARRFMRRQYGRAWQAPLRWVLAGALRAREELEVRAAGGR